MLSFFKDSWTVSMAIRHPEPGPREPGARRTESNHVSRVSVVRQALNILSHLNNVGITEPSSLGVALGRLLLAGLLVVLGLSLDAGTHVPWCTIEFLGIAELSKFKTSEEMAP